MTSRAKLLLQNHKDMLLRQGVLEALIGSLEALPQSKPDEAISELVLSRQVDGMPTSGNHGSQTEYVAMNYQNTARAEMSDIQAAIQEAKSELAQVRIEITLYNAMLTSLSGIEPMFVKLRYEDKLSINRISEISLMPDSDMYLSPSTLRRLDKAIVKKVDAAIGRGATIMRTAVG